MLQVAVDSERFNTLLRRSNEPMHEPLYTPADVQETLPLLTANSYDQPKQIAEGTDRCVLSTLKHILG